MIGYYNFLTRWGLNRGRGLFKGGLIDFSRKHKIGAYSRGRVIETRGLIEQIRYVYPAFYEKFHPSLQSRTVILRFTQFGLK